VEPVPPPLASRQSCCCCGRGAVVARRGRFVRNDLCITTTQRRRGRE
jgi:hypothetical protein